VPNLVSLDRRIKPPLKWAGGKRWLLKDLREIWKPFDDAGFRLVEPFCGGLAITLGLMPDKAYLNDINPHLINFYTQLKEGLESNIQMKYNRELYYENRKRFNELISKGKWNSKEGALLFYYLNHTGYNGLCRFNQQGFFNVPFGEYKSVTYLEDFSAYQSVFRGWKFSSNDFEELEIEKRDFIYADPPYDVEFRQYSSQGFTWEEQIRLAKWIKELDNPCVISNQATDRIIKLYKSMGFKLRFIDAPRMISCTGDRKPAREVLAMKIP
jgi:DNA adenine methylase